MNYEAYKHMMLESSMQRAIDRKEFQVFYQAKVETRSQKIVGMEALARWLHPEMGLIKPQDFISIAEESGLIFPLSEYIMYTACRDTKAWQEQGFNLCVSLNLSVKQFQNDNLLPYIKNVLEVTGLSPGCLEFEITESITLNAEEESIAVLSALKAVGMHISIDDFGTGYSSFSYLKEYPIDILKIDKSFIDGLPKDTSNAAITDSIINLARNMGYAVVAEGVENADQFEFLKERSCYAVQGYYFSKPMPALEFERFLRDYKKGIK